MARSAIDTTTKEMEALHAWQNQEMKGGGFDKLTLDSLYDEGTYRRMQQQQLYGSAPPNPFMASDPFAASNQVAPPSSVQMAAMAQQPQQMAMMMQPNPLGPPLQPQHAGMARAPNPFLDAGLGPFPVANGMHPQANPFGTTQLLEAYSVTYTRWAICINRVTYCVARSAIFHV